MIRNLTCAILVGCFLAAPFFCKSAFSDDKRGAAAKIKELKRERLVLLVKIHDATAERLRVDTTMPFDQAHKAMVDVFAARLDLAETRGEWVRACEDLVKYAEAWEEEVKKLMRHPVHPPSRLDLLRAQAYVLESRITLEKARAAN